MKAEVTVRMYRQGLGDCFLVSFHQRASDFHLLIDCGALNSKHYDSALMRRVVEHIVTVTNGTIDVIALTHEHWDHISGFVQAKEIFEDRTRCKVGAVWTAWTEDPDRKEVARLKARFKKKKATLRAAVEQMSAESARSRTALYRSAIEDLFGFFGGMGVRGRDLTQEAWQNALKLGPHRYLDPRRPPVELASLPGVRFYCLGPPDDPEMIKRRVSTRETYEGDERGMSLVDSFHAALHASEDPESAALAQPFDAHYRIPTGEARTQAWFQRHYAFHAQDDDHWRSIDEDWLAVAAGLALHLDSYTNNTCLALAVELGDGGPVMLFPGDAQVGNWLSWEDLAWEVRDADGRARSVTSDDLLARTVLYKVGHHGSHNATLKGRGLEKMRSDRLVAMIPVHRDTASDQKWEFPFQPLLARLKERTRGRVLLADSHSVSDIEADLEALSPQERDEFVSAVRHEALCVTYTLIV